MRVRTTETSSSVRFGNLPTTATTQLLAGREEGSSGKRVTAGTSWNAVCLRWSNRAHEAKTLGDGQRPRSERAQDGEANRQQEPVEHRKRRAEEQRRDDVTHERDREKIDGDAHIASRCSRPRPRAPKRSECEQTEGSPQGQPDDTRFGEHLGRRVVSRVAGARIGSDLAVVFAVTVRIGGVA